MGIRVYMLTGDNAFTAKAVAEELDLDGFQPECLPEDKYNLIKKLQNQGHIVAMAGDGINDAPALEQANVGIAMGTGTDIAMQSAEITLVKGDLNGIVRARELSIKGNCGMCEKRIETAAGSVEGMTTADWNQKSKKLEVTFDGSKTTVAKIQMAVANVGHDTPMHKAKDEVYNKLPACCKYDRTESKKTVKGAGAEQA